MLKRVDYLDLVPADILYELIFSLKSKTFDKDAIIHAIDVPDLVEEIYFIEEGIVEVTTEFEMNDFTIDKLGPGSVINYRAVFLKDQMYVNMTAMTEVKILSLPLDTLMELVAKHGQSLKTKDAKAKEVQS